MAQEDRIDQQWRFKAIGKSEMRMVQVEFLARGVDCKLLEMTQEGIECAH
jgi:hypothetical protein